MERDSLANQGYKLESQIREAYGRITYTQTCHEKKIQHLIKKNDILKTLQIVLSALTTGSFLVTIFTVEKVSSVIGALCSVALLMINTYTKNFDLTETTQAHQKAANLLWKIREEYVSLLTDFELLDSIDIMSKRDELQERTAAVYSDSPRTDAKCYAEAQKALKTEEEQTFSESEIDVMLPNSIRRCNRSLKE